MTTILVGVDPAAPAAEAIAFARALADVEGAELQHVSARRGALVRLHGEPAEALARHSSELDLLVTGSRGYGPLRAVIVGGVSGRLLRTAQWPVIVVRRTVAATTP